MIKRKRYYTIIQISLEFDKLTKDEKIYILYDALGFMQKNKGISKFLCIAMAMGYKKYEGRPNTYIKK